MMNPTKGIQGIQRKDVFEVYDIYSGDNYKVEALEDEAEDCVKIEFDEDYIRYARWVEPGEGAYEDEIMYGYWEMDSGNCN
jgi:hypothetical protein